MRCLAIALVAVVTVLSGTSYAGHKHGSSNPNDIIYDLSRPWPFHQGTPPVDADGDGVFDANDKCPGTPRGAVVDANGCPLDADADGVADGIDRCPGTPAGAAVDASGCPMDSDKDGVFDGLDKCPGTPQGATVDATGCPLDADGDGVFDGVDQCPETLKEYAVDDKGCPIPVSDTYQQFLDSKSVSVQVQFASGKADILSASEADLRKVGEVLSDWPEAKVEIAGHTDSQGSASFNNTLSARRAESVKSWLTSNFSGINGGNLSTKGKGESEPVADNATDAGRAQNRRVTFTLLNANELGKDVETRRYKKRTE